MTLSDYPEFDDIQSCHYTAGDPHPDVVVEVDVYRDLNRFRQLTAYLGIDVGSTSTKAVLVDLNKAVVAGFYTRTAGKPLETA